MLLAHYGGAHTVGLQLLPLAVLLPAAMLYFLGLRHLPTASRRARRVRSVAFYGALLAGGTALLPPLERMAEVALSAHMVQHMLLLVVTPSLLVTSRPAPILALALPRNWARRAQAPRAAAARFRLQTRPVIAAAGAAVLLWTWHLPALYESAVHHPAVHAAEHGCFLLAGLAVWHAATRAARRPRLLVPALGALMLTSVAGAALGALLAFSPHSIYEIYGDPIGGLTAHEHQQLAGVIMWLPGFTFYAIAAGWIALRWSTRLERAQAAGGRT